MLYENDLNSYGIQDFCMKTLKQSAEFNNFITSLSLGTMSYETDTTVDSKHDLPDLPFVSAYAGDERQDERNQEWGHTYEIPLVFGIEDVKEATIEDGVKKFLSPRNIEKVAKKALTIIKNKMSASGINGDYEIQIISADGFRTPSGEEDEINYILSLTFSYLEDINKGC